MKGDIVFVESILMDFIVFSSPSDAYVVILPLLAGSFGTKDGVVNCEVDFTVPDTSVDGSKVDSERMLPDCSCCISVGLKEIYALLVADDSTDAQNLKKSKSLEVVPLLLNAMIFQSCSRASYAKSTSVSTSLVISATLSAMN